MTATDPQSASNAVTASVVAPRGVYFPNLNGVRFLAAALVIVYHCESMKRTFGLFNYRAVPFVDHIGRLGVVLFFVLSGFLITYLLLEEKRRCRTIDVKYFYARRALRVWPLYYAVTALGFFVLPLFPFLYQPPKVAFPYDHFASNLAMYVLLIPNVTIALHRPVAFVSQAWSVGVEEQFYLFWPVLLSYIDRAWLALAGVLAAYVGILLVVRPLGTALFGAAAGSTAFNFWLAASFSSMAIGGLYAYALHEKKTRVLGVLFNCWLQYAVLLTTAALVVTGLKFSSFNQEIYAALFGLLIINLAANPNRIVSLDVKSLDYLGKISYGLYMYHPVVIALLVYLTPRSAERFALPFYLAVIAGTSLVAAASYEFFEKRFLRFKVKYTHVASGDNSRTRSGLQSS